MPTVYSILGSTVPILARIVSSETLDPLVQSDIESITYTIKDLDTDEPVDGYDGATLAAADVILDTPVTREEDARWEEDDPYNWLHEVPAAAFVTGDKFYSLRYTIDTVAGSPLVMPEIIIKIIDQTAETDAYAQRQDVEMIFGSQNVEKWADLDNREDQYHIAQRISWALELAKAKIDDTLRDGPYEIPFSAPYPTTIKDVNARWAGVLLYDSRGIQDTDEDGKVNDNLKVHRVYVEDFLKKVLAGKIKPGTRSTHITHPEVYDADD